MEPPFSPAEPEADTNDTNDSNDIQDDSILSDNGVGSSIDTAVAIPTSGGAAPQHRSLSREHGESAALPLRQGSPVDTLLSFPDDAFASPGAGSLRPFGQRFHSRLSTLSAFRPSSPGSVRSRSVSFIAGGQTDTPAPPWEVVRWTRLVRLADQAFSETARRSFGAPTCLALSSTDVILATTKGFILTFDHSQNIKALIGPGTRAVESGAILCLAVSSDQTTVAAGHANGDIFTWEATRPTRPFMHIPHLAPSELANRTADGHVPDVAITHLGFLGSRRTALVSADDRGMAFSHLATRGTGPLGRTIKTTRILGRYPDALLPQPARPERPSTVLAFAPLPLGTVESAADALGLTALLTPYLLVIVSTTPIAQTQHKSARPKDIALQDAVTGCLAWFPAMKLRPTGDDSSQTKLVYCWSNVLTVLDVAEIPSDDADKPAGLQFQPRSRWKTDEPIVAVQWIRRSVIAMLTLSQRLIFLEDKTLRVTDGFDLVNRHIYHADLFSDHLGGLSEGTVVPDAFYMSFKAFKGRIFLLGFGEVAIGALTNWHDRLVALMKHGDYVGAIRLATSYYTGDADNKLTIGLPEDDNLRHPMVREKLVSIMNAALKHVFDQLESKRKQRETNKRRTAHTSARPAAGSIYRPATGSISSAADGEDGEHRLLHELTETCFAACNDAQLPDFLFDIMFEWYDDDDNSGHGDYSEGVWGLFIEAMSPYILDGSIKTVPPSVVKGLVRYHTARGWESRLEVLICHLDTATLDLDQITQLCRQHSLYDALTYVWNRAMGDFITPLIDLLKLLLPVNSTKPYGGEVGNGKGKGKGDVRAGEANGIMTSHAHSNTADALKIFPYLAYTLTGRIYPTGEAMADVEATRAKSVLYWFLFSGSNIAWPRGASQVFRTRLDRDAEPSFPYLQLLLRFDAASLLSVLDEAFEDPFLNDPIAAVEDSGWSEQEEDERAFAQTIGRQYIVSILVEMMSSTDFPPVDTIYLDMFVARNLPKFPQYILLPGWALARVLAGLCAYPAPALAQDAQLSAEYLLSVFQPPDIAALVSQLRRAGFFRVLKSIYRAEHQFDRLIAVYFEDPDGCTGVFDCIADCLRLGMLPARPAHFATSPATAAATATLTTYQRQLPLIRDIVARHGRDLLEMDASRAAHALASQPADLHCRVLDLGDDAPVLQYTYLHALLEPSAGSVPTFVATNEGDGNELVESYVRLMCRFDRTRVAAYVSTVPAADLRLDRVLSAIEDGGAMDAAVMLMARDGLVHDAMDRLIAHLDILNTAVEAVLGHGGEQDEEDGEEANTEQEEDADELLSELQKYVHVGIWLCQRQSAAAKDQTVATSATAAAIAKDTDLLSPDEALWLRLVEATVLATRCLTSALASCAVAFDTAKLLDLARSLVQHTFTALLAATMPTQSDAPTADIAFLRILRAFLARAVATSPTIANLRAVLQSVFAAYAYEESILRLANRLLDRSLFTSVSRAASLRQRGWRPRSANCDACGRRVWGPGASGNVYEAWEDRRRLLRTADRKGKASAITIAYALTSAPTLEPAPSRSLGPLVVLACRHVYHESCLAALTEPGTVAFRCPVDG